MIVYGDPQFEISAGKFFHDLRARVLSASPDSLEDLRTVLIQAGQLEQAVCDSAPGTFLSETIDSVQRLTDFIALAFYAAYTKNQPELPAPVITTTQASELTRELLAKIGGFPDRTLTVKVPEGFAFYALFPEQYIESTLLWLETRQEARDENVIVVGIRSIGTTLSAVVLATLENFGWQSSRRTVRLTGHPFDRRAALSSADLNGAQVAIVVDEGPGASGSSMAAVAESLARAGITPEQIAFFPGHDGEPGHAASPRVRDWWNSVPVFSMTLRDVAWEGLSSENFFIKASGQLLHESVTAFEDWSAGHWRHSVFRSEHDWPAVAKSFERMKFCCRSRTSALIWKFAGLGFVDRSGQSLAEKISQRSRILAEKKFCPALISEVNGFIATRVHGGRVLQRSDARSSKVLYHLANFLIHTAGPPLPDAEHNFAVERLANMLAINAKELFGTGSFPEIQGLADEARDLRDFPSYTDGRMAPHEWLRQGNRILKADAFGHEVEHTIVGRQSLLWDIAGVMIEWDLSKSRAEEFLTHFDRTEWRIETAPLNFYLAAFAAFRAGQMFFCAGNCGDTEEKSRLVRAANFYAQKLRAILTEGFFASLPRFSHSGKPVALLNR